MSYQPPRKAVLLGGLLVGVAVLVAGNFLLRNSAPKDADTATLELRRTVEPFTVYQVVTREYKRMVAPSPTTGRPSMENPPHLRRTTRMESGADCELVKLTMTVADERTGEPWYTQHFEGEEHYVEYFSRAGVQVTDENRIEPLAPAEPEGPQECGELSSANLGEALIRLGLERTGTETHIGVEVERYEGRSDDRDELRSLWRNQSEAAGIHDRIVSQQTIYLVEAASGIQVATWLYVVLDDGTEELLSSQEVLSATYSVTDPD